MISAFLVRTSQRPEFPRLPTLGPVLRSIEQSEPTHPSAHRHSPANRVLIVVDWNQLIIYGWIKLWLSQAYRVELDK
jgi:hypothetical protein